MLGILLSWPGINFIILLYIVIMATAQETAEKASDKELRGSDRNKGDKSSGKVDSWKVDYSLPATLQVKER